MSDDSTIILRNVRVSYPHLFKQPMINGELGKCGATLLLHPVEHAKELSTLRAAIGNVLADKFKGQKLPMDRVCLRNGDDRPDKPEYAGYYYLTSNVKDGKTPVVFKAGSTQRITDDAHCEIYAGCRVNAKVQLWGQNNQYGKRVNAMLIAIQFVDDDESLEGGHVSEEDAREGFDDAGDSADQFDDEHDFA